MISPLNESQKYNTFNYKIMWAKDYLGGTDGVLPVYMMKFPVISYSEDQRVVEWQWFKVSKECYDSGELDGSARLGSDSSDGDRDSDCESTRGRKRPASEMSWKEEEGVEENWGDSWKRGRWGGYHTPRQTSSTAGQGRGPARLIQNPGVRQPSHPPARCGMCGELIKGGEDICVPRNKNLRDSKEEAKGGHYGRVHSGGCADTQLYIYKTTDEQGHPILLRRHTYVLLSRFVKKLGENLYDD